VAVPDLDPLQLRQPPDPDHVSRREEPVLHVRHHVGAAGEEDGVARVLVQEGERLRERRRSMVGELRKSQHVSS